MSLGELLERRRRLATKRAAAVALALEEAGAGDQLARKSLEEVLRLAEAARREAPRSYSLDPAGRRLRPRLRGEPG